jgi:hypothetical protein
MSSKKTYTFNVVYCEDSKEGKEFAEKITQYMESNKKRKGYYADRDLFPGRNVINEFFGIVRLSKYTILVIDKKFLKVHWSLYLGQSTLKLLTSGVNKNELDR